MSNIDLNQIFNRIINYNINNPVASKINKSVDTSFSQNIQSTSTMQPAQTLVENQVVTLQKMDMATYAKEVMQFPKNLNEFIFILQKGLNNIQFNQMFAQQIAFQRNALSQLQAQILAQLQGLTTPSQIQAYLQAQTISQMEITIKNLTLLEKLSLSHIAEIVQKNGKEALAKLFIGMTEASKQGVKDLTQLKEMASLINASIAASSKNDPAQTLKALLLLYLPCLPLDDGVNFNLEFEQSQDKDKNDSILIITITTVNYGTVKATLILETSNSLQVEIECQKDFPKEELLSKIDNEKKHYSFNSSISFSNKTVKPQEQSPKAKVNMSQTNEINSYMLLMAHMIIRYVIDIDNKKSL